MVDCASIFILIENDVVTAHGQRSAVNPTGFLDPVAGLKSVILLHSEVDNLFDFLKDFALPIGRYFYGISGTNSNRKALNYFKQKFKGANKIGTKAIQITCSYKLLLAAEYYRNGTSILTDFKKNEAQAVVLYQRSLEWWPYPGSLNALGYCFAFGIGTPVNIIEGIKCFETTIRLDRNVFHKHSDRVHYVDIAKGEAHYYLGYLYKNGLGVTADLERATTHFQFGSRLGNKQCEKELS